MLFAQPRQATNAAARAELCYISLASPALSLWPTNTHISSLHKHVAAQKTLESPKNWSGHGVSNRTGSAGPVTKYGLSVLVGSLGSVRNDSNPRFFVSNDGGYTWKVRLYK